MRDVIKDVCIRVEGGDSFSQALVKHPKVFNRLFVCTVDAGEKGGLLAKILSRLATFLENIAHTCGDVVMEKSIRTAMSDIEKGDGISNALAKHPVFPTMIIRMMTAGEQTGKIDSMLERIADFLDEEIETVLSGLTSLIEPLLIVFLGVVVGGIVICMFLPIFKMSEIINPPGK